MLTLFDYYRSSASYRVRIALNLKGIDYKRHAISLLYNAQQQTDYIQRNPSGLVPALLLASDNTSSLPCTPDALLGQSLAIIEYLDEIYPQPNLLPLTPLEKAQCREIALTIACDIHPLNNLRVLQYLSQQEKKSTNTADSLERENFKREWYHHWLKTGFDTVEQLVLRYPGPFCFSETPTIADICLIPQIYNAKRFNFDITPYERITRIDTLCSTLPAFCKAHPDHQQRSH